MTSTYPIPNMNQARTYLISLTSPFCSSVKCNDYLPASSQPENDLNSWPWSSEINQKSTQTNFEGYLTCPSLSPDLYTPISTEDMNYFDTSFKATISPTWYNPISTSTATSPLGNIQGSKDSFFSTGQNYWEKQGELEFPFSPSLTLGEEGNNMDQEGIDPSLSQTCFPRLPSPISEVSFTDMVPLTLPPKRNSAITKTKLSSRRNSRSKPQQKKPSLRLANPPKMEISKLPPPPPCTPTSPSPNPNPKTNTPTSRKTTHNLCEKKYRNRLNGEFSKLLTILPREVVAAETSSPFGDPYSQEDEKRIGKAEILILAKNYIENLERQNEGLEKECTFLGQKLDSLKG